MTKTKEPMPDDIWYCFLFVLGILGFCLLGLLFKFARWAFA